MQLLEGAEVLGWAAGERVCHLIIARGVQARAACSPRVKYSGQVHRTPPEYCSNKCVRCEITEARQVTPRQVHAKSA